jgi:hypothetical protein
VYSCKKFRHYLLGYKVIFHTDHDSLKYLVNKPDLSGWIARWILLLQEFNYEVVIKSGKANSNADYLSRQRSEESVADISAEFPDEFLDLPEVAVFHLNNEAESEFLDIINYLVKSEFPDHFTREEKEVFQWKVAPYSLIKGILFKVGPDEQLRRCLEESDRKKVIESLHSGNSGGHFASVNMVNRIRTAGHWSPYMNRDIKNFVDSCD